MVKRRVTGGEPRLIAPGHLDVEAVAHQHHDVVLAPQHFVLGCCKDAIPHDSSCLVTASEASASGATSVRAGDPRYCSGCRRVANPPLARTCGISGARGRCMCAWAGRRVATWQKALTNVRRPRPRRLETSANTALTTSNSICPLTCRVQVSSQSAVAPLSCPLMSLWSDTPLGCVGPRALSGAVTPTGGRGPVGSREFGQHSPRRRAGVSRSRRERASGACGTSRLGVALECGTARAWWSGYPQRSSGLRHAGHG